MIHTYMEEVVARLALTAPVAMAALHIPGI
jgi:hypothetical protein